jgi:hypothetical protein
MVSIILLFVIIDDEVDHSLQNLMQSFNSLWLARQVLRRSLNVDVVTDPIMHITVGVSLLAIASGQAISSQQISPLSRASSLLQVMREWSKLPSQKQLSVDQPFVAAQ